MEAIWKSLSGIEWLNFGKRLSEVIFSLLCYVCSIMNSLVIVLFLSGMVAMIMLRTLHKDIARYNQIDNSVSITNQGFLVEILCRTIKKSKQKCMEVANY